MKTAKVKMMMIEAISLFPFSHSKSLGGTYAQKKELISCLNKTVIIHLDRVVNCLAIQLNLNIHPRKCFKKRVNF